MLIKRNKVMTREEKDLLLNDLCSRLPHGVIIEHEGNLSKLDTIFMCDFISISSTSMDNKLLYNLYLDEVKPYLYPLSSMTEEQNIIYGDFCYAVINSLPWDTQTALNELVDWLNKNHFDYRGLIEKGLAIEVTEDNNPYKK